MNRSEPGAVSRTPGWFPKVAGEQLRGRIIRYGEGETKYGSQKTIELKTPDGERRLLWLSSTVLKAKVEDAAPKPGDLLDITYLGRHPLKGYHLWAVEAAAPPRKKKRRTRKEPRLPGLHIAERPAPSVTRPAPPPDPTGEDPFDA